MPKLFGFSIDDSGKKPDSVVAPVPQNNEDGVDYFIQSGFYGQYVDTVSYTHLTLPTNREV